VPKELRHRYVGCSRCPIIDRCTQSLGTMP
jgi:hypothetical protein